MERIRKYEPLWGSWKVKRKIGEGSFGAVYEAEKTVAGNTSYSAVKLISFNNSDILRGIKLDETISADRLDTIKEETAKKNIREAALMDKLQGRANIVTIHDYEIYTNEKTTDVLIRMELLTNLRESIEAAKIDTDFVIKFGIDICRALESCEKENIIHRDIKPENIFINKDGDFKLGDFGLSRQMSKSASMSLRKAKGTPLYMSPEAFGWGQHVDNTSDIYSLGIVMYQLLNDGKIPFCEEKDDFEEEDNAIGRRLDGEEFIPPSHEDGELWKIIKKACQYQKENRYQSVAKMREELEKLKNTKNTVYTVYAKENCQDKTVENDVMYSTLPADSIPAEEIVEKETPQAKPLEIPEWPQQYNVGDTFTFGSYPQDSVPSAGKKPIEWLILKKEDDKMLVISKKVLDCKPYHDELANVTWETSDIRWWLNEVFYEEAFDFEEQEEIQTTLVKPEKNPDNYSDVGKETIDKVFLLSTNEAEGLFDSDEERKCQPSEYAIAKGVDIDNDTETCDWWLRSPGEQSWTALEVYSDGSRGSVGNVIEYISGVRPAMWLNLGS